MSYVTEEFYLNTYHGNSVPSLVGDPTQDFLEMASRDVDTLTRMKIKKLGGFSQLSEFEKIQVQLAVCAQADHLYSQSSYLGVGSSMQGVSSYSIGDISVSLEKSATYDARCIAYLRATNLLYRGL